MPRSALTLLTGLSAALISVLVLGLGAPAVASAASASAGSVWCTGPRACSAVGSYTEANGAQEGLLLSEVSGRWLGDQIAALPAGAAANPSVVLNDLACSPGPDCVAVGDYDDGAGNQQALVLSEHNGAWAVGREVKLPANAIRGGEQLAELNALWCATAADCVAVGDYTNTAGDQEALTVTERNGVWSAGTTSPVPAGAAADPQVALTALDCAAINSCDATGIYSDQSGNQEGMVLTGAPPYWAVSEVTLPADAAMAAQQVQLNALACGAPGDCAGAGAFIDDNGNEQPLIVIAIGAAVSTLEPQLPADADTESNPEAQLTSIRCAGDGDCTAVGDYNDANSNQQGLMFTQTGGIWGPGQELALPENAAADPQATLNALWCTAPGDCVAGGSFAGPAGAELPLLATESNGAWGTASSLRFPAGAAAGANQTAELNAIFCTGLGSCSTVGDYTAAGDSSQPLLASSRGGVFGPAIMPAAPPSNHALAAALTPLTAAPAGATLTRLADHGHGYRYLAVEPGTLVLDWRHDGALIATSGSVTVAAQGTVRFTLALTAAGRRLAASTTSGVLVQATASFKPQAPAGSPTLGSSTYFTLS